MGDLSLSQFEFDFLRGNYDLASARLGTQEAGNRTEVSACADHKTRFNGIVNTPGDAAFYNALKILAQSQSGAATLQKIIIKFASKDPKTHHMVVENFDFFVTKHAGAETSDRLKDAPL